MGKSAGFRTLERELTRLRAHLLPATFSPTGAYTDEVHTATLAYRLLAHAEFEYYLEERVRHLYIRAISTYDKTGSLSRIASSMLAFAQVKAEALPETIAAPASAPVTTPVPPLAPASAAAIQPSLLLAERLRRAGNALAYAINQNQGIKEKNLLQLLIPIGFDPSNFDPVWLALMNAFGEERGVAAHKSRRFYRVTSTPNPKDELDRTNAILQGFAAIDDLLNRLR